MYTNDFTSPPLINPNVLFHKQNHGHLLQSLDLSPIHIQIFPNESNSTCDMYHFDEPCGLETDLTILFYKEDELLEKHKGKIINQ